MSTAAISYSPILGVCSRLQSLSVLKPISPRKLSTSGPTLFSKYSVRLPERTRIWGEERSMAELTKPPILRTTEDVEGFGVMEQEAMLSNGSSAFHPQSVSGAGLESTINKMSKWLVAAVVGVGIIWKHDGEALWALMGCVTNAWLSVILKKILNQERPVANLRSDPGMPSSHAQSIFFAVVYAILSMVKFLGLNGTTVAIGVLALASGSYLSWLRVSQKLHTMSQISVGAIIGTIFSMLWFQAWYAFVLKAFIASVWVRIFVVLGSFALCVRFLIYVIQNWLREEP